MIHVRDLSKRFGDVQAVDGVSFSVEPEEVLGLLGPNGAGKTTTIRMMMDILKPDRGTIEILGAAPSEARKSRVGYLPEERGLYKGYGLVECLAYLGALKGLPRAEARQRASDLVEKVGLGSYADRKIQELSKGMAQKAQFLAAIVHDPEILILDEPFQGLDPVNTELLKGMLLEERRRGKAIILSTHNMSQVEELCGRIVLIHRGQVVLHGPLDEIKRRYAANAVVLECDALPDALAGVAKVEEADGTYELLLDADASPQQLLRDLVEAGTTVTRFEVATAPLEQVFIGAVEGTL